MFSWKEHIIWFACDSFETFINYLIYKIIYELFILKQYVTLLEFELFEK